MPLPVTLLYGGICALLVTLLGTQVSLIRLRTKTFTSTDLPRELVRPVRAHGNAAEWVPLGILLLAMLELSGLTSMWLHLLGGALVAARVLHAFGILAKNSLSVVGATLNYLVLAAMSGWAIWLHFA